MVTSWSVNAGPGGVSNEPQSDKQKKNRLGKSFENTPIIFQFIFKVHI